MFAFINREPKTYFQQQNVTFIALMYNWNQSWNDRIFIIVIFKIENSYDLKQPATSQELGSGQTSLSTCKKKNPETEK